MIGAVAKVKLGWIGVARSEAGLSRVTLPRPSFSEARALLGNDMQETPPDDGILGDLPDRLQHYFEGEAVDFLDELDLSSASPFRQAVWRATCSIPFGETRSYRWVAEQIGKPQAARAVGQALAANPLAIIIPCHRVIASNGGLRGFGGGLETKRRLLEMERSSLKLYMR